MINNMLELPSLDRVEETQLPHISLPDGNSLLNSDGSGLDQAHEGIFIRPQPGFTIKTKSIKQQKLFINVTFHDAIQEPGTKKKLDESGKEVEGLNLPLSMGLIRQCSDREGNECVAVDGILNPVIREQMEQDATGSQRDFVCQLLMQCFVQKYKDLAPLDRKYSLPKMCYFGYIHVTSGEIVRKKSDEVQVLKQYIKDLRSTPKIEDVSRSPCDTRQAKKEDVSLSAPICIHTSLQLSDGQQLSVQQYLNVLKVSNGSAPCYVLEEWDQSLPLPFDTDHNGDTKVTHVIAKASITKCHLKSMAISVSTYSLHISGTTYHPTQCILLFPVEPREVVCKVNMETLELCMTMAVQTTATDEDADVGSEQWLIARALSRGKPNSSPKIKSAQAKNSLEESREMAASAMNEDTDDPFHLQSLFPWNRDKPLEKQQEKHVGLPEDKYHEKDFSSQHLMQQQEEEKMQKMRRSREDREETDVDNVHSAELKPREKVPIVNDKEHLECLKSVEAMLKRCVDVEDTHSYWFMML